MVRNGEISKADALIEIEQPLYDQNELDKDKEYFCKKLDFDEDEFDKILSRNPKSHLFYKSDQYYFDVLRSIIIFLKRMKLPLNMLYKKLGIRV